MGEASGDTLPAALVPASTPSPTAPAPTTPPATAIPGPAMSPAMAAYFRELHDRAMACYDIARKARAQGKDPTLEVEIPPAEDLAARVEAQVGPPGVAALVRQRT